MQILVVEDEKKLVNVLRRGLLEEHYAVSVAYDGEDALEKIAINEYDCIILDLMIPKVDGMAVLKKVRQTNTSTPVIILTAKTGSEDKIEGLDQGADDYITKPFSFSELTARIRALLRRGNKADPPVLSIDDLTLNPATRMVKRGNTVIMLTSREFALLEYFLRNQNKVLTETNILEHVWDFNYEGLSNVVATYVKYLRKKLKVSQSCREIIHTMRGCGYVCKLS
ncbi:MAG: response regulator transcription factor [Candidatus Omnitrophota bacterium]|jgi:DNA-binding response OmpR family regulator